MLKRITSGFAIQQKPSSGVKVEKKKEKRKKKKKGVKVKRRYSGEGKQRFCQLRSLSEGTI